MLDTSKWTLFKNSMAEKYGADWLEKSQLTKEEYHEGILAMSEVNDVMA